MEAQFAFVKVPPGAKLATEERLVERGTVTKEHRFLSALVMEFPKRFRLLFFRKFPYYFV